MAYPLVRHPDFPCDAVQTIDVEIARIRNEVRLTYTVSGAIGNLTLPAQAAPERMDELWKHTCFELFVRPVSDEAYCEFNFSPSTAWAAYAFDGHRSGMREFEMCPPRLAVTREAARLVLDVDMEIVGFGGPWRCAVSAVIEERDRRKSYWALRHPAGRPDFHAAAGFLVEL
jgi:hypothetical protein